VGTEAVSLLFVGSDLENDELILSPLVLFRVEWSDVLERLSLQ
jgi:hypothetical protein